MIAHGSRVPWVNPFRGLTSLPLGFFMSLHSPLVLFSLNFRKLTLLFPVIAFWG